MELRYFQKGFNYSQDGPGNRLVIHLQGCNLHCPWCSNPEGMDMKGGIAVEASVLVKEILSCRRLFFDGGGVTFTGGECTMQKDALTVVLKELKQAGVHTAIETNATCDVADPLFSYVDLIICDFKHYDSEKMQSTVGGSGAYLGHVADYVRSGKEILVRTPLINGFNASPEDAERFAHFFVCLPTDKTRFEFLPYHEYGKKKWQNAGKEYRMEDAFVSDQTVALFEEVFRQNGLKTVRS